MDFVNKIMFLDENTELNEFGDKKLMKFFCVMSVKINEKVLMSLRNLWINVG